MYSIEMMGCQKRGYGYTCIYHVQGFSRNFSKESGGGGRLIKRDALDPTNVRGHEHTLQRCGKNVNNMLTLTVTWMWPAI